jgi:spore coat protein U-like protein
MRGALVLFGLCVFANACPGFEPRAGAATATDTFQVTATVVESCNVDVADLNFGAYNPIASSPLDGVTTLHVICTNGTTYTIGLDAGTASGASVSARAMTFGSNTLGYGLYQDAAHALNWGQTDGIDTVAGTGSGVTEDVQIYGRAPALQAAPAGSYADTITVTVSY